MKLEPKIAIGRQNAFKPTKLIYHCDSWQVLSQCQQYEIDHAPWLLAQGDIPLAECAHGYHLAVWVSKPHAVENERLQTRKEEDSGIKGWKGGRRCWVPHVGTTLRCRYSLESIWVSLLWGWIAARSVWCFSFVDFQREANSLTIMRWWWWQQQRRWSTMSDLCVHFQFFLIECIYSTTEHCQSLFNTWWKSKYVKVKWANINSFPSKWIEWINNSDICTDVEIEADPSDRDWLNPRTRDILWALLI